MENYKNAIKLKATTKEIFDALTIKIPFWWTEMFEGSAHQKEDLFTVRFGKHVFKTMKVQEIANNSKVVWKVKDSLIAITELKNQTEWIGTTIVWEINTENDFTELQLVHKGLNHSVECYDICSSGWQQFIQSLKLFVETGKGKPYIQQ